MPFCPGCQSRWDATVKFCPECGTKMDAGPGEVGKHPAEADDLPVKPPAAESPKDADGSKLSFQKAKEQAKKEWLAVCSKCRRPSSRSEHQCPACGKRSLSMTSKVCGFNWENTWNEVHLCCPSCQVPSNISVLSCPHCETPIGTKNIYQKRDIYTLGIMLYPLLAIPLFSAAAITLFYPFIIKTDLSNEKYFTMFIVYGVAWISLLLARNILARREWAYKSIDGHYDSREYHLRSGRRTT